MILTCELCQNQFLTESDPHVVIPGKEIKIYCYCQVKQSEKKYNVSKLEYDKDKEAFNKYVEANKSIYFGLPDWEVDTDRTIWEAACNYKQKEIDELLGQLRSCIFVYEEKIDRLITENAKLNQEIEKFKGYLEAWGSNE
jgi:hypothetical protein